MRTFSSAILLAIKPIIRKGDTIAIDNEYPNQMRYVINWINRLIRHEKMVLPEDVVVISGEDISAADAPAKKPLSASYILRIDQRNKETLLKLIL